MGALSRAQLVQKTAKILGSRLNLAVNVRQRLKSAEDAMPRRSREKKELEHAPYKRKSEPAIIYHERNPSGAVSATPSRETGRQTTHHGPTVDDQRLPSTPSTRFDGACDCPT